MMRTRCFALLAVLVFAAAACGGAASDDDTDGTGGSITDIAPEEGVVSRVLGGRLELEVSGAVEASWSGETPINVVTGVGGEAPREFWQLTVGVLAEHVLEDDDGLLLRPAFDLLGYHGGDTYEITPNEPGGLSEEEIAEARENPESLARQGTILRSGALLDVGESAEDFQRFNVLGDACTLDVEDQGLAGTIDCPAVSDGEDVVAFRWSWEADPDDVIETDDGAPEEEATGPDEPDVEGTTSTTVVPSTTTTTIPEDTGDGGYGAPFPLEVAVDPEGCATRGDLVTVRIDTVENAFVTLAMGYSDAQSHGNAITGTAGPSGTYNWAFVVPQSAPDGEARLLVNVTRHDGSEAGGGIETVFEVRPAC